MPDDPVEGGALPDPTQLVETGVMRRAELGKQATAEADITLILFELGGERYAIPLQWVTKIERVPTIVPVPRTPAFVRGIASLRGEVVTVVDFRAVLGTEGSPREPHGLLVLCDGPRRVGILSDILPDYFRAKPSSITPAPHGRAGESIVSQGFERDDGFVAMIDVKKLMDALERRFDAATERPEIRAKAVPALAQATVTLLPFHIGPHAFAIEAIRVIEVLKGKAFAGPDTEDRRVVRADLHRLLGVEVPAQSNEIVLARADGRTGRGDGLCVAFAIDRGERLATVPIEVLAPLPTFAREQIQVDFIVGVVIPHESRGTTTPSFLLDPGRLARAAQAAEGSAHG